MKQTIWTIVFFCTFLSFRAVANPWGNCGPGPQTEAIQDVFWKSDVQGSNGPEYTLKSGQTFSNTGALCRSGQVLKSADLIAEMRKGINPAKSVSSFQEIHSADEFQKFLKDHSIEVDDSNRLNEAVTAFLESKPTNYESMSGMPGKASNPIILVGASQKEALLMMASSDGKTQFATAMQFKLR
jgi:hypothetical protein